MDQELRDLVVGGLARVEERVGALDSRVVEVREDLRAFRGDFEASERTRVSAQAEHHARLTRIETDVAAGRNGVGHAPLAANGDREDAAKWRVVWPVAYKAIPWVIIALLGGTGIARELSRAASAPAPAAAKP